MEDVRNRALSQLNRIVETGRQAAIRGLEALQREYGQRRDFMVRPDSLEPDVSDKGIQIGVPHGGGTKEFFGLTHHSHGQLLARASMPVAYADTLMQHQEYDLLRSNLVRLFPKVSKEGIMVRAVGGTAKGILSSSYRRMDASPVFESYATTSLGQGMVPYQGEVSDTRAFMSFLRPEVREIFPGEHVVIGTQLRSSDYGRGALEMLLSVLRLLCTNGMMGMDFLRKVHLGKRFDADEFESQGPVIVLSQKTLELDSATVQSALTDTMKALPAHMDALTKTLAERAEAGMKQSDALALLKRKGFSKEVQEKASALYEAPVGVESLPQGEGAWRWANVISLLANGEKDADTAADLRDAAFALAFGEKARAAA